MGNISIYWFKNLHKFDILIITIVNIIQSIYKGKEEGCLKSIKESYYVKMILNTHIFIYI